MMDTYESDADSLTTEADDITQRMADLSIDEGESETNQGAMAMDMSQQQDMDIEPDIIHFYEKRFDDSLGDRYYVYGHIINGSPVMFLEQTSGLYSQGHVSFKFIEMTLNEWKTMEHAWPLLRSAFDMIDHDCFFEIEGFHINGHLYADLRVLNDEAMLWLYKGTFEENRIKRKNNNSVCLDKPAVDRLGTLFEAIDLAHPLMYEAVACCTKGKHSNDCVVCYPWCRK